MISENVKEQKITKVVDLEGFASLKADLEILKNEINDLERDNARLYRMIAKFKGVLESRGDFEGSKAFTLRKE